MKKKIFIILTLTTICLCDVVTKYDDHNVSVVTENQKVVALNDLLFQRTQLINMHDYYQQEIDKLDILIAQARALGVVELVGTAEAIPAPNEEPIEGNG